jgi:hypothetical protein
MKWFDDKEKLMREYKGKFEKDTICGFGYMTHFE